MAKKPNLLLMDANVLIDYRQSDFSVLGLVNNHVGGIHVLTPIIDEVDDVDFIDCERLGMKVIEPELSQVKRAAAKRGALSFRDHLCLVVAADDDFVCVTNDKSLRRACEEEDVSVMWGLEVMTALVHANTLCAADAIQTAEKIQRSNPLHINESLVARFSKLVTSIEKRRSGK